ncbi:MAG TPA: MBL fold metallo-hydrolase [Planctomycetota bacterium]|nr:MBL fold metallo-hydrolase [Planctomycetota bacterium]
MLALAALLASCAVERAAPLPSATSAMFPASAGAARRAPGATLTYLGVAGWSLSDGQHVVLVDPYFSRPALDGGLPVAPDEEAIARLAPPAADLILVGHSHVDHVLDAPSVARRTGAQILGSVSTAHDAHACGLPAERIIAWRAPLGAPLSDGTRADLERFAAEIHAAAPASTVLVPEPLRPIEL